VADKDIIYTEQRLAWASGFPYIYLHDGGKVVTKTAPLSSLSEHFQFTHDAIVNEHCTIARLLPHTVVGLLDVVNGSKYLLKTIITAGLPVSRNCMESIGKTTAKVINVYGSTEAGVCSSEHITDKHTFTNYSTGFPNQGVEIKVVGPDGLVVKKGECGTIFVRSPGLFHGYFNDEQSTNQSLTGSRWMNTDDRGYIDQTGRLIVTGRCSDVIRIKSAFVLPSSVEAFIKQHPGVHDVIVLAVPDDVAFEVAAACIIPKAGSGLTDDDMIAFFKRKHLPSASEAFLVTFPELIFFFDDFPRPYTGKPNKKKLKAEAIR